MEGLIKHEKHFYLVHINPSGKQKASWVRTAGKNGVIMRVMGRLVQIFLVHSQERDICATLVYNH
jgi:hypothetical protein